MNVASFQNAFAINVKVRLNGSYECETNAEHPRGDDHQISFPTAYYAMIMQRIHHRKILIYRNQQNRIDDGRGAENGCEAFREAEIFVDFRNDVVGKRDGQQRHATNYVDDY